MRLLNTQTLRLEDFAGDALPPYAILSHTWGNSEVSFQSLESGNYASHGNGYLKIRGCCKTALLDGFEYIWVDTCCINKESSAELSEAINSMYRWYSDSDVCYVYLSDVPRDRTIPIVEGFSARETSIVKSRYFTRSWTLQELIAPQSVIFFDKDWYELGTKASLSRLITYATGIQTEMILNMVGLNAFSVAQRMAWASKRYASREEDVAYSLIGIMEVNMPMLYGEGKRAFIRLQEEIVKITDDQSIFAWSPQDEHGLDGLVEHVLNRLVGDVTHGLFALSPFAFANCSDIVRSTSSTKTTFQMTNRGVHTQLHIINSNDFAAMDEEKLAKTGSRREPLNLSHPDTKHCAVLNCERIGNSGTNLALVCRRVNKDRTFDQTKPQLFQRYTPLEPLQVTEDVITRCQRTEPVYILKHGTKPDLLYSARKYQKYSIETSELGSYGFPLAYYPTDCIKIDADYKLVIDKAKLMGDPVSPTDRYGAVKYAFPDGVNFALVIRKSGHDLMFNVIGPLNKTETLEQICLSYFPNTPVEQVTCQREWVNSVERAVLRHEAGKQSIHLAIKRRIVAGQRRTIVSLDCIAHEPNDTEMDNID